MDFKGWGESVYQKVIRTCWQIDAPAVQLKSLWSHCVGSHSQDPWMGVQEEVSQAKVVAWPSCLWFKERNQTYCCDVPTDLLLASTVKDWVMELNVGFSFCRWNNRSNIRALTDKVWASSSWFLSSPALSMQTGLQVFEKSGLRKQPNYYEHKPEPGWSVQLFLSKPSVCLSPGIFYQYWSFQVIYFDSLHDDMI